MNETFNNIFTTVITFFTLLIVLLNFLPNSSNILRFYESNSFYIDAVFLAMFFISLFNQVLSDSMGEGSHKISYVIGLLFGVSISYSFADGMIGNFTSLYDAGFIIYIIFLIPFSIMFIKGIMNKIGTDAGSNQIVWSILLGLMPLYWLLFFAKQTGFFSKLLRNVDKTIIGWIDLFMIIYVFFFLLGLFMIIKDKLFPAFGDIDWFNDSKILGKAKNRIKDKTRTFALSLGNDAKQLIKQTHSYYKDQREEKKRIKQEERKYKKGISKLVSLIKKNEVKLYEQIKVWADKCLYFEKEKQSKKNSDQPLKKLSYGIKQLHSLYQLTKVDIRFKEFFDLIEEELNDYLIEVCDVLDEQIYDIEIAIEQHYEIEDIEYVLISFFKSLHNLKHYNEEVYSFIKDKNNQQWLSLTQKSEYQKMVRKYSDLNKNYSRLLQDINKLKVHNEIEKLDARDKFYDIYSFFINRLSKFQFSIYYVTHSRKSLRYVLEVLIKEHQNKIYLEEYMKNYIKKEFKNYFKNIKRINREYESYLNTKNKKVVS